MTVAALLPAEWKKRLVDTNVERLRDRDLEWADVVMLGGMHIQQDALVAIVERCRARGLRTVVGGPIASSVTAADLKADHVVIGEAESLIGGLARGSGRGNGQACLSSHGTSGDGHEPLPDLSLIKMRRYSTMRCSTHAAARSTASSATSLRFTDGGPRTKAVAQVLAELDQLRAAGWREAVFIVDDNFIGNKARAKELCAALAEWRGSTRPASTSSQKLH